MTDEELKALVASVAEQQKETDRQVRTLSERMDRRHEETERHLQAVSERMERSREETDRHLQAVSERIGLSREETDRQLRDVNRQVGGLSNKFGSFTEGLAYRSCKRILKEHFRMEQTLHEVEVEQPNGQNEEYDMLGVANGRRNEVVVVEIKSQLRERDLEQTLDKLRRVPEFMPQYKSMKIHGMIAAVYLPKGMQDKVEAAGLYLATGADENFTLLPPSPGFQPQPFGGL